MQNGERASSAGIQQVSICDHQRPACLTRRDGLNKTRGLTARNNTDALKLTLQGERSSAKLVGVMYAVRHSVRRWLVRWKEVPVEVVEVVPARRDGEGSKDTIMTWTEDRAVVALGKGWHETAKEKGQNSAVHHGQKHDVNKGVLRDGDEAQALSCSHKGRISKVRFLVVFPKNDMGNR